MYANVYTVAQRGKGVSWCGHPMWHNSVGGKMNILHEKNLIFYAQQILNY